MADEREDVVDVGEVEEIHLEELADEDKDLLAHPEWTWIAREPQKMGSEIYVDVLGRVHDPRGGSCSWEF
jgi:hypothetical protein